MHTHMVFVLKKLQETWLLKQREGRSSVLSLFWVRECKEIHSLSLSPSLWWSSLLELAGNFTVQWFSNGNALTTKLKFFHRKILIFLQRKILWEKFEPSVSFLVTFTQARIFKNQYETLYYVTVSGTWMSSVRTKHLWNLADQFTLNFFTVIVSVGL